MSLDIRAKCPYNNAASEICVSSTCYRLNPFICNNICRDSQCYSNHRGCKFMGWGTCKKKLTTVTFDKGEAFKEFVAEVDEIYGRLVEMVESQQRRFRAWHTTVGLNPAIAKFLEDVAAGKYGQANGSQIFQMLKQGNPQCPDIRIKELTKVDNLYFRQIHKCQEEVLAMVKSIYEQPIMKQYLIKGDPDQPAVQLQSRARPKDNFFQLNKQKVVQMNGMIHQEQLDLRGMATVDPNLRIIQFLKTDKLRKLILSTVGLTAADNRITSLEWLGKANLDRIQHLYLDYNAIVDVGPLRNCRLVSLQDLRLDYNQIVDISPLAVCDFRALAVLHLNYNQITSVEPITKFRFPMLRTLLLFDNNIDDLQPLLNMDLPSLQLLQIYGNKAKPIQIEKLAPKLKEKYPSVTFKLSF